MDCTFENRGSHTPMDRPNDVGILSDLRGRLLASDNPGSRPPSEDPFRIFNDRISEGTFFPQEWTGQDPELMHHYTIYTSKTIARRPEMQETWQVAIPQMAYSNEFLMHGILALSALHLAYLKPEKYSFYLAGSGFHMSLGLRSYRRILLSPSSENCHALFCFSSFIMVYIYASPTESTEHDAHIGLESILELLGLCRGTLVLLPYFDLIRQSSLEPLFLREFQTDTPTQPEHRTDQFKGITIQLTNLHHLIESEITPPDQKDTFFHALDRLQASFESIQSAELPLECGMLYMWPLSIEENFFILLRQQHPVALVFLAFYCAQLHAFSDYWFVGRQGAAWLSHVSAALPGRLTSWLVWPRAVVSAEWDA
ncbi:hypothetical protein BDW59DRAFT_148366 [Aspergillus cavernicola]|uniref:C6 transcription factor n=1 Tax=Aspergillus cavernicola TaxID=176166 RepID=A0ABR4I7T8_9EURO